LGCSDLKPVDSSSAVFEAYAPFSKALAARIADGEAIRIEAKNGGRMISTLLPAMPKQINLNFMAPQFIADKVSRQIDTGEIPKAVYGGYSLRAKGDSYTLVVNTGDKPLAHWQLKSAQRRLIYPINRA
jgi:hypothetical protein